MHHSQKTRRNRRGSIYVVTMSAGLIVAVLATTALTTARVQRLASADVTNLRQAQVYAEGALKMAQYRMSTSPTWRSQLAANTWATDQSIADGFLSFTGRDPIDNDLADSNYEPVEIVATGKKGTCLHKLKGRFEFTQPGINCLGSGVHAKDNLIVDNATLNSLVAPCSSNLTILSTNFGKLYANCESATSISTSLSGQIFGTKLQNQASKQMPTSGNVLNSYLNNGTTIAISALPLWDRQHLTNTDAEVDVANWTTMNCNLSRVTSPAHGGTASFYLDTRTSANSYMYQDVTAKIAGGVSYYLESWIYVPGSLDTDNFRIRLQVNATGGNTAYTTGWVTVLPNVWTLISGTGNVTWTGNLQSAYWYVETQTLAAPYHIDDCVMKEANAEASTSVIHRALLTPQINSLTAVTNPQGIYIVDCQGQTVNVRDTRINGTLVLRNPSITSRIEGSMNCEASVVSSVDPMVPNLLAIVADKKIKIALSSADLDERLTNRNFNPSGSPYLGVTDADLTDTYPSQINGIVYSLDDLLFGGTTTINGAVISDKKVEVRGTDPNTTSLTVQHNALYRYVNPPVDFRDSVIVSLKSSTVSRVVD